MPAMEASELKAFAKGPKPTDGDMHGDDPEAEESEAETETEARDFTNLVAKLTEFAEDVEASADEIDPDVLSDMEMALESDDSAIIHEGYENLDKNLRKELDAAFPLVHEEAMEIAGELEGAGAIEDAVRIGGYLMRLSEIMQNPGSDEGDDDAESDDDADDADDGGGEGGNPY